MAGHWKAAVEMWWRKAFIRDLSVSYISMNKGLVVELSFLSIELMANASASMMTVRFWVSV